MSLKTSTRMITPYKKLHGTVEVPGDKSISHRALILGSIASGKSEIRHISPGKDCRSTFRCLRDLGIKLAVTRNEPDTVQIEGYGHDTMVEPGNILNSGNSGTTMRLLCGILAAQPFHAVLNGDHSLRSRPMDRVIEPLRLMGAEIYGRNNDRFAPLTIKGNKLQGITYELPVPSAQIKSAVLLAGLYASGKTSVIQSAGSRDHTELLLEHMGAELEKDGLLISVKQIDNPLLPVDISIPGDISSAAYWLVAGAIHPDAKIKIEGCGLNPTRTGIIDVLKDMGANIKIENKHIEANEQKGDIYIESSSLKSITLDKSILPRIIDEVPIIAVAACFAEGNTVIRDATELRIKESDRITTTVQELSKLGAKIEELPDGMIIHGGSRLTGAKVKSHYDHRLAMSLSIAGLVANGRTTIHEAHVVDISYPSFWEDFEHLSNG
jgi:3-phosphoshikimate 1-carboxyvinyltransferase